MKTVILLAVIAAALLVCIPHFVSSSTCYKTCYKKVRYSAKCGLWSWKRCTRYKSSGYTCGYYCRHGGWSSWRASSYGSCSRTCGGGTRSVNEVRYCNNPTPLYGGRSCSGSRSRRRTGSCNTRGCPRNGAWSAWSSTVYECCSAKCGRGTQNVTHTRTCTSPSPQNGGKGCLGVDWRIRQRSCSGSSCPRGK